MSQIKYKNFRRRDEQGSVLIIGVIVMVFLLILAVPFLFRLGSERRSTERSSSSLAALSLAEAGVERAIWELNKGDVSAWSGDDTMRTLTIHDFRTSGGNVIGDIAIKVANPESDNPVVESTGRISHSGSQAITRTVRVVLERLKCIPFDGAAFGSQQVTLNWATVDSWDSRLGKYGGANVGSEGHVGTNSTGTGDIKLNHGSKVHGDAYAGYKGDPNKVIQENGGSVVYGSKSALDAPKEMPSIPAPEGLPDKGNFVKSGFGTSTLTESGAYGDFVVKDHHKLTIPAGYDVTIYVTNKFNMDWGGQIQIEDGASLRIVLGDVKFSQSMGAAINNMSKDPTRCLILGTDACTNIKMDMGSDFYGAIYAPNATVSYWGSPFIYGSVVGKKVSMDAVGYIHYDVALQDLDLFAGLDVAFLVQSWQEMASPKL